MKTLQEFMELAEMDYGTFKSYRKNLAGVGATKAKATIDPHGTKNKQGFTPAEAAFRSGMRATMFNGVHGGTIVKKELEDYYLQGEKAGSDWKKKNKKISMATHLKIKVGATKEKDNPAAVKILNQAYDEAYRTYFKKG